MKNTIIKLIAAVVVASAATASYAQCNDKPIVMVHGWNSSASTWKTMKDRFTDYGIDECAIYRFNYDSLNDNNRVSAQALSEYIDDILADPQHSGFDQVKILAHSNGGLVARWYRVFEGGASKSEEFITLGTPHDGTNWADFCSGTSPACQNMQSGSGFLNTLGSEGCVHAIWSEYDEVINPDKSAKCDGDGSSDKIAWSVGISHSELNTKGRPWQKIKKEWNM